MCREPKGALWLRPCAGVRRCALVPIVAGLVAMMPGPAAAAPGEAPYQAAAMTHARAAVLIARLINWERRAHRRRPLTWQPELARLARAYSREMVACGFFSHVAPGGADLRARATATRYLRGRSTWRVGETLAWAAGLGDTPTGIVAAWFASPAHRRVLLDRRFREVGVGVVTGAPVAAEQAPAGTCAAELGVRGATTHRLRAAR